MKRCPTCATTKPVDAFGKSSRRSDGLRGQCKACESARQVAARGPERLAYEREWRKNNADSVKEAARTYKERHPDRAEESQRKYRAVHRETLAAKANAKRAATPNVRERERAYEKAAREKIRARKAHYYDSNKNTMLARAAGWRKRRREHISKYNRAQYASSKEQFAARRAVRHAVLDGRLVKPSSCNRCGRSGLMLYGHHHSYELKFWLDVEWLCKRCHIRHHVKERAA